jgi:hypothetical protein
MDLIKPGQFGVYRRVYVDPEGNRVCCYVAINKDPFARIGTPCQVAESESRYHLLRGLGIDFREAISSGGRGYLPRAYQKEFVFEPKAIIGDELLANTLDPILLKKLVLDNRRVQIIKTSLGEEELRNFEEGYMLGLMG